MTLEDVEAARQTIEAADRDFTKELAWEAWGDEDFGNFLNDPRLTPWGEEVRNRRPNPNAPRALFVGSNTSWLFYQTGIGRPDLDTILMRHGLTWDNLTPVSRAPTFWAMFFGRSDFFSEESDIPTLVVTTGEIRTNGIGGGLTHTGYGPHLQEIAKDWRIAFEQLELPKPRPA
jgi:hypothetical protein